VAAIPLFVFCLLPRHVQSGLVFMRSRGSVRPRSIAVPCGCAARRSVARETLSMVIGTAKTSKFRAEHETASHQSKIISSLKFLADGIAFHCG